jgi:hypothetical protein
VFEPTYMNLKMKKRTPRGDLAPLGVYAYLIF